MIQELAASHDVELFVPQRGGYISGTTHVRIHEVPVSTGGHLESCLAYCSTAADLALRLRCHVDVFWCHDWMTVLAGVKAARIGNKPLLYNVHLPQHESPTQNIENIGLVCADAVVVNSKAVEVELEARNLEIPQMAVIPNGVDLRLYRPPRKPFEGEYILFVGRLTAQKGVQVLLRAFGVVLRKLPEAQLVIVGDGELELQILRAVRTLGFPHRVKFAGWQTGTSLLRLYQRSQVVVIPSYYEPFGIVALEAMACGRPVIVSQVGGLAEIVADRQQGFVVPFGNYMELAQRLVELLQNPALRRQMGKAARLRASEFGWSGCADQMRVVLERLVNRPVIRGTQRRRSVVSFWSSLEDRRVRKLVAKLAAA
jgi:glycosyltransferase involved in cell wall biosynthesis